MEADGAPDPAGPDPYADFTFLLLGLLSFSRRFRRVLQGLHLEPEPAPALDPPHRPESPPARLEIRDLLR